MRLTPEQLKEKLKGDNKLESIPQNEQDLLLDLAVSVYGVMEQHIPAIQGILDKAKADGKADQQTMLNDAVARFIPRSIMVALIGVLNNEEPSVSKAAAVASYIFMDAVRHNNIFNQQKKNKEAPASPSKPELH